MQYAAIFIDYENIYYFLINLGRGLEPESMGAFSAECIDPSEATIELIRTLKAKLEEQGIQPTINHAYADFERINANIQGDFYLLGIDTHNVLGTDHKNAADMRLCIDAMETLYTRSEISTFVLVAGDRDYIPLVQHLKKHAKNVLVVSFEDNVSGDLLQVVGANNFIDALTLFDDDSWLYDDIDCALYYREQKRKQKATKPALKIEELGEIAFITSEPIPSAQITGSEVEQASGLKTEAPLSPEARNVLEIILCNFHNKHEIWMTPCLRRLREEMPSLAEHERRALITELEKKGAIFVEKREGEPYPFSVILLNYNHPDVRELYPGE